MEGKIDIHRTEKIFDQTIDKFKVDASINPRNREILLQFFWDCRIGKTIKGRSKKKIGKRRVLKYLYTLKKLSIWLGKPFDKATPEDMEKLVFNIEEDVHKNGEKNYSEQTKLDFKKSLNKFFKWLGRSELVDFMDMTPVTKDVPVLTREEAERMINSCSDTKLKAAIMALFDGGARVEEFLNLRMSDLTKRNYDQDSDCYWINIRYSKTEARTIPLPLSCKLLNEWLSEHPERDNPDAQVFPFTYASLRLRLRTLGQNALKKHITPHMLRHSSATYWAPKMNHFEFCAKYGWGFNSDMPNRYIKRKGIIFEKFAKRGDVDQLSKIQEENSELRENLGVLKQEYKKIRQALEFIMPAIMGKMDDPEFKSNLLEGRKEQLVMEYNSEKPVSEG